MSEYDAWAVYYDLIHHGLPGEAEFYAGLAIRAGGETLELGCGTGRIAIPMAMCGARVTGLDLSPAMLALCREKLHAMGPVRGRLRLVEGDMREFSLRTRFRSIIMPYRTFMHLLTPEDQVACLQCVRRHIHPKGCFAFNVWKPDMAALAKYIGPLKNRRWRRIDEYRIPRGQGCVAHYHRLACEPVAQRMSEEHRLIEYNRRGSVVHEAVLPLTRAWCMPRELEHLCARCGWRVEAVLGDFDGRPFHPGSIEMIWVLRPDSAS